MAHTTQAMVILLQETHRPTADKLAITNFTLAGSILSKKHGLATFVHNDLSWTLADRSPDNSEIELLRVDVGDIQRLQTTTLTTHASVTASA